MKNLFKKDPYKTGLALFYTALIAVCLATCWSCNTPAQLFDKALTKDSAKVAELCNVYFPLTPGKPISDSAKYKAWKATTDSLLDIINFYEELVNGIEPYYLHDTVTTECGPYKASEKNYIAKINQLLNVNKQLKEQLQKVPPVKDIIPWEDTRKLTIVSQRNTQLLTDNEKKDKKISHQKDWLIISLLAIIGLIIALFIKRGK